MNNVFLISFVAVALLGCSKEVPKSADVANPNAQHSSESANSFIPSDPSEVTVIETAEIKDKLKIRAESAGYFAAKDFSKLDDLANNYRTSKACSVSGVWKLESVYTGIIPDEANSDDTWKQTLAMLHDWIQAKPDSITARVALADTLVSYAWKARGSGYANTVTETGWKFLGERLTEAVIVLKDAEHLQEKCPLTWYVMMSAALGLGVDKARYETLFQKAIASEPDFTGYYFAKAYYLSPRWHGNPGDMAAFLQKAADQIGGEDGDLFYARVAWYVQCLTGDVFDDPTLSWARVDRGFEVMEKRFPDSAYAQNGRAYMAVMGSDKMNAPRRLVGALHGQIDLVEWTSITNFLRLTKDLH
ncbi:MAG TPA: DUF4034 domain-containing protein [Verrucomicrobiae bacterium]|nr:DUF4034 domain-containing protein [Verrucomicrobiae bacterium]